MNLHDMRLYAAVVDAGSFTGASRALGIPKQTLSRRIAALERALGVRLLHRTTRRLRPTDVGAAYAARCDALVRLADEANAEVVGARTVPSGVLKASADAFFAETFLGPLLASFLEAYPEVDLDLRLTSRRVDLIEEGLDCAFRIGVLDDRPDLYASRLADADIRYCASPAYLARRGTPSAPADLTEHDCIVSTGGPGPTRWPMRDARGAPSAFVIERPRVRAGSFAMARALVLAGRGIGVFPTIACAEDIDAGRLVPVLDDQVGPSGAVWLVRPARDFLPARVRAFVDHTLRHFRDGDRTI